MSKQSYWIRDIEGVKALVEGAETRDTWVKVHGWQLTEEPTSTDLVWLQHNETGGKARFAAEAAPQWAGLGWHPSAPPEPVDLTKDPQLVDQPAADLAPAAAAAAGKPKTTAAAGADKHEE